MYVKRHRNNKACFSCGTQSAPSQNSLNAFSLALCESSADDKNTLIQRSVYSTLSGYSVQLHAYIHLVYCSSRICKVVALFTLAYTAAPAAAVPGFSYYSRGQNETEMQIAAL